jgi:hypothetical protein
VLPPLHRPSNTWKAFGQVGVLGRRLFELFRGRKVGENSGEQKLSSPVFCTSKGRKQYMKRRRFGQNVSFNLNENNAKLMSKSKSVFNLYFVQSSPQLQFEF